jgi:hypothetical protein
MDTTPRVLEFTCPECQNKVTYDPADPVHYAGGAMLRKVGGASPSIVYLTCVKGHVRRYQVTGS